MKCKTSRLLMPMIPARRRVAENHVEDPMLGNMSKKEKENERVSTAKARSTSAGLIRPLPFLLSFHPFSCNEGVYVEEAMMVLQEEGGETGSCEETGRGGLDSPGGFGRRTGSSRAATGSRAARRRG
jgi:hypothetical protein